MAPPSMRRNLTEDTMRNVLIGLLLGLLLAFAAGCNTTKGVGKDVEAAGEKIQETAKKVEKKI